MEQPNNKGLKKEKSISGERFIRYDKTNKIFDVTIKIDNISIRKGFKTKEDAIKFRNDKVSEIYKTIIDKQNSENKLKNKALKFIKKLEELTKTNNNKQYVLYDKCNANYKVWIKFNNETLLNTARTHQNDAIRLRNYKIPEIISILKGKYKL